MTKATKAATLAQAHERIRAEKAQLATKARAKRARKPAEQPEAPPILPPILPPAMPEAQARIDNPAQLAKRAMLVTLSIQQWAATKQDKKVTGEVHDAHKIDPSADAGKFNKNLLCIGALKDIQRVVGFARNRHLDLTLPWGKVGQRILSAHMFDQYMSEMREFRQQFEQKCDEFAPNYPAHVAARALELNGMFNPNDYPDGSKIRDLFRFRLEVAPLPVSDDFRVELGEAQLLDIRAEIEATTMLAVNGTVQSIWKRIAKAVEHMTTSLREYKPSETLEDGRETKPSGVFRNSLVENIRELVELMPGLNFTNDPALALMSEKLRDALCEHSAEELRESDNFRNSTADKAEAILAEVAGFLA